MPLELEEMQLSDMTTHWKERRAESKAYKYKKLEKKDLVRIKDTAARKDLPSVMKRLDDFAKDCANFEEQIIISESSEVKLERSALEDIQGFLDLVRQLKTIGVPPAIVNNYSNFIIQLLDRWQKDVIRVAQHCDNLKEISGTLKQEAASLRV